MTEWTIKKFPPYQGNRYPKGARMKSPEGFEKDEIKAYLKKIDAFFFLPFMGGYGKRGVPDIVACIKGTFWGIEVKREGFEPTALLWQRMAEVEAAGGKVAWGTADKVIGEIDVWTQKQA